MAGEYDQILWWTNVWAIGVVMYELTTLHRAARVLYNQPDAEGRGCPAIFTNKTPDYSSQLCDTIRNCLNMDPSDRPTLIELRQITRRFARITKDALAAHRPAPDVPCDEERLYYRDNEINDMPAGAEYLPSRVHARLLRESGFWNPDVSVLRYPNFTPFEDSDGAGDEQDEAEMAGVEGDEGEEERGWRFQFAPGTNEDEDGRMDVDEPTVVPDRVVPDRDTEMATVRADGAPSASNGRFAMRTNIFGKPRMGW